LTCAPAGQSWAASARWISSAHSTACFAPPNAGKERIPLGVHLMPAVGGDGRTDQVPALGQHPRVPLPQRLDQPRGALHIGEQEHHRAARKPAHRVIPPLAARTGPHHRHPATARPGHLAPPSTFPACQRRPGPARTARDDPPDSPGRHPPIPPVRSNPRLANSGAGPRAQCRPRVSPQDRRARKGLSINNLWVPRSSSEVVVWGGHG